MGKAGVIKKAGAFNIKKNWWKVLRELYLFLNIFLMLFPLVFMVYSSTKSMTEFYTDPFALPKKFPADFLDNLKMVWTGKLKSGLQITPFINLIGNTALLTFTSLIVMIIVAILAGYGISRWNFKLKTPFILFILVIQTVPFFGYVIPMLLFGQALKLTENIFGVAAIYVGVSLPTAILLFQSFYKTFPRAVEEAALIDGCGEIKKFLYIIVPMSKGIIASLAIINFMGYWNEVVIASLFLTKTRLLTISVAVINSTSATGVTNYAYVLTLLTLSALPNLIVFSVFSKNIMRGISLGGVKG